MTGLLGGGAVELRARLLRREVSCAEIAEALLGAVGEDPLRAWAAVAPDQIRARAAQLDAVPEDVRAGLPLFGVPVGIKDNFKTRDLPTTYGSPIYAAAEPSANADADAVDRLRRAGAMIAGKLRCAEFAWMTPPDTRNPLDPARTPGGSSSGSAAAVAAGTIPLATGTQTAGSINRPASYCGVLGYKPSFGLIPRTGVKLLAPSLDTVGLFARNVADLRAAMSALVADRAVASEPGPAPQEPAAGPRLALLRTPFWDQVESDAQQAIEASCAALATARITVDELPGPAGYQELAAAQTLIQSFESARSLRPELDRRPELLSDELRAALEAGARIPQADYELAKRTLGECGPALIEQLQRYDAVLTPSATGVPPLGLAYTGDPRFCRVWTLLGAPSVSLPLAWTPAGLPVGLQLIGAPGADAQALAVAEHLLSAAGR